mmetsp:Transcript_88374/g.279661  ORF Transcript_88374/g.279661 Transcript_88374/m.279661 type:complete len:137 (-) Transcript_88374:55-465(-)
MADRNGSDRARSPGGRDDRREKRRARSDSESGTPDWLKKRREKQTRGEIGRAPAGDFGGGGGYGGGGGGKGGGGGGKGETRPGDWSCSSCGMNNFARRTECFKCGTPKPSDRGGGGGDRGGRYRSRSRSRGRDRRY